MRNLNLLLNILIRHRNKFAGVYYIPDAWNYFGYSKYTVSEDRAGQVNVNPYDFIGYCISKLIIPRCKEETDYLMPLDAGSTPNADINRSIIYSMFPRALMAWDHYEEDSVCPGTFLKAICYLPYLRNMGVDILYLLPIFECGRKYKKGELSSPYATKNFYRLDRNLHDELLGEYSEEIMALEFKAFMEACHALGMKVMVDYAFRTVSRDNDLIWSHPEWFYWIKLKYADSFSTPLIEEDYKGMNDEVLKKLYNAKGITEYLNMFSYPPNELDPEGWMRLKQKCCDCRENMLDLIEEEYGLTTAPGFSDVINDVQPPWTDVTYLKYYFDVPEAVKQYIPENQPPYILQDGASLSIYHGKLVNTGLWEYIAGVIPYYQEEYGIDGARIDMGHALPDQLNRDIVSRARQKNNSFILWSEEFDPGRSEAVKKDGFNFISGYTWVLYKDIQDEKFNTELAHNDLLKSVLPITAAMETPDTPRASYVHKEEIRPLVFINSFLPNAIPFINNGLELMEIQPMNLGLDNTEEGRYVLDRADPMYGKLAFFDKYRMHWLNVQRKWMEKLIYDSLRLRKRFEGIISKKENFIIDERLINNKQLTTICYYDRNSEEGVFLIANRSLHTEAEVYLSVFLPGSFKMPKGSVRLMYSKGSSCSIEWPAERGIVLPAGDVIIGCNK